MSQAPAPQSFPLMSGDKHVLRFTITDASEAAVDLTGGSGQFAMGRSPSATTSVDSDASPATATVAINDAAGGILDVTITAAIAEALQGDYYWELRWTDSSGNSAIAARGWITVYRNMI